MGATDIADGLVRLLDEAQEGVGEMFEPTVRLGVTGLSRAGKTVFITSLAANLLRNGRMTLLDAAADGRIEATMLRPQPDRQVPRFDYEGHLGALTGAAPRWPDSTRQISQLRISMRYRSRGWLAGATGLSTLHLDIVDYPGEWLLDLPLLSMGYREWSDKTRRAAVAPGRIEHSVPWLGWTDAIDPSRAFDEADAREGAARFTVYLAACRASGMSGAAPGRFLMPGDLEGSPALTFTPLPAPPSVRRGSLYAEMKRRFEAYKRSVVKPFFVDHFTRFDRQVVLVDALSAIGAGPRAVADLRDAMVDILGCFRPGRNSWLSSILGRRVDRILFAATKADHIHHADHPRLAAILEALLRESVERAAYRGAGVSTMAIAALRSTVEQEVIRNGCTLPCVRGRLLSNGREAALYPGELPADPAALIDAARCAAAPKAAMSAHSGGWLSDDYRIMSFAPPVLTPRAGEGPPHIRLDKAAQFLFGDKLR